MPTKISSYSTRAKHRNPKLQYIIIPEPPSAKYNEKTNSMITESVLHRPNLQIQAIKLPFNKNIMTRIT